jgi:hypothetical protein
MTHLYTSGRIRAAGNELMVLINKLTNWQRNQWAKAGYPTEPERVRHFLALKHR